MAKGPIYPPDMGPPPNLIQYFKLVNDLMDSLPPKVREALKTSPNSMNLEGLERLASLHASGTMNEEGVIQWLREACHQVSPTTQLGYTPVVKRPSRKR